MKGASTVSLELTEQQFQKQVTDLAEYNGWQWMHVERMGDLMGRWRTPVTGPLGRGWPDLILFREHEIVAAELKRDRMMLSYAQRDVYNVISQAIPFYVWRPSDWDQIVRVLA